MKTQIPNEENLNKLCKVCSQTLANKQKTKTIATHIEILLKSGMRTTESSRMDENCCIMLIMLWCWMNFPKHFFYPI